MKFKLRKASDFHDESFREIDINTLDDLKNLQQSFRDKFDCDSADEWMKYCSLIIDFVCMEIVVYDYWIE